MCIILLVIHNFIGNNIDEHAITYLLSWNFTSFWTFLFHSVLTDNLHSRRNNVQLSNQNIYTLEEIMSNCHLTRRLQEGCKLGEANSIATLLRLYILQYWSHIQSDHPHEWISMSVDKYTGRIHWWSAETEYRLSDKFG